MNKKTQKVKITLNPFGYYSMEGNCYGEICTLSDLFEDVGDWIGDWLEDPKAYWSKKSDPNDIIKEDLISTGGNMVFVKRENGIVRIENIYDDESEFIFWIEEDKLKKLLKKWKELTSKKVKKIILSWDRFEVKLEEEK